MVIGFAFATVSLRSAGLGRQVNDERGPLTRSALSDDGSAVPLHYFTTNGQPDSGPLVLTAAVQPLENFEHPVRVCGIESDAVVRDGDPIAGPVRHRWTVTRQIQPGRGSNGHHRGNTRPVEFERV